MPDHWRYEKKFLPEAFHLPTLVSLIRRHPAAFREVYPERLINNVYFDTPVLNQYYQHVDGAPLRRKVRVRWYGTVESTIPNPVLEFKIKRGSVNSKTSYRLPAMAWKGDFTHGFSHWRTEHGSKLPPDAKGAFAAMGPTLFNRYRRLYFQSASRRIRVTLDFALAFADPRNPAVIYMAQDVSLPDLVLEMKYAPDHADEAHRVASEFPFRSCRCSKYVMGMGLLGW
jgi:hypothetical protein